MNRDKLDQMTRAAEAAYLAEHRKIQPLLQEEARLRADLARLQAQADTERQKLAGDLPMQSIGADLLWQGWLVRSRKQLNFELSQVLARKTNAMDRVRHAFGRRNAVETLRDKAIAERDAARRKKQMETLMQAHTGSDPKK